MTEPTSPVNVDSEQRGPHWVAWVVDASGKPAGSVVLVGRNRKEAEERARGWGALQKTK